MKKAIFAALMAFAATSTVQAATVYDNGGPDGVGGNETTRWFQAEDFSLAADASIVSAGVYLGTFDGTLGVWDGSFEYNIFSDAAGTPGASLASGSVIATTSDSGVATGFGTGNSFLFEFDLNSAFAATAGTTYWFSIHASTDFDRDELYWVTSGSNGTSFGEESDGGTFDNWFNNGNEHAFYLSDTAVNMGAVPEPATWAFMIMGFG
ncbi:MAG: hypothetical protein ABJG61_06035, partial [Parasphingorhabdus sp.]